MYQTGTETQPENIIQNNHPAAQNQLKSSYKVVILQRTNAQTQTAPLPIKLAIIGDSEVGKSSIVSKIVNRQFDISSMESTLGAAFHGLILDQDQDRYRLQMWDTSGQQKYMPIVRIYLREIHCVVVVFDMSDKKCMSRALFWLELAIEQVKKQRTYAVQFILCGNKSDLAQNFDEQNLKKVCAQLQVSYVLVSAKELTKIDELIDMMIRKGTLSQNIRKNIVNNLISQE